MTSLGRAPRRPNLATIVGSGLAVVAAGSLLAFSTLAEQAGLQGLATRGVQPAAPHRAVPGRAITIPAPAAAPPSDPGAVVDRLVEETVAVVEPAPVAEERPPFVTPPQEPDDRRKPKKPRPEVGRKIARSARVAFAPTSPSSQPHEEEAYGPPYGHGKKPKKQKHPKHAKASHASQGRGTAGGPGPKAAKPGKKPKPPKAAKGKKNAGKALGHTKHDHGGHGQKHGKGHGKHDH